MPLVDKKDTLGQFIGTENWHQYSKLFPRILLTDGALFVAQNGGENGAFWLMDAIASHQPKALKNPSLRDFQLWELKVSNDKFAVLTCRPDSNEKAVITQRISYTDFDLPSIKFYCEPMGEGRWCILFPSEH